MNQMKIGKKKDNSQKGIALIWVILIIVVVIILSIIGIALFISNVKSQKDKNNNQTTGQIIDNYLENNTNINVIKQDNVIEEKPMSTQLPQVEVNTIADVNSTIDGKIPCFYNPVIPQGFKAINTAQDSTISEDAKWGVYNGYLFGLVIQDINGNQFVWVPVENMDLFKTTDWNKNIASETIDSTYIEPISSEKTEYNKMYQKVKKYGGFYIGRYETGDESATGERTAVKNSDSIGIKKALNVYNYVPFKQTSISNREITGAKELTAKFAKTNNYNSVVTTSVMYGVQWDAMLRFIVSDTYNVNDSIKWGNYSNSELKYTDINGNIKSKEIGEVRLLKAGTSEQSKAKNIYDIAGNVFEWTIEAIGNDARIVRGGSYVVAIGQLAASRYAYNYNTANNAIGFRISFYIN